jgi:hypothetical protein
LSDALINYRYQPTKVHEVLLGDLYWQVQLVLDLKRLIAKQSSQSEPLYL